MGAVVIVPLLAASVVGLLSTEFTRQVERDGLRENGFPQVGTQVFADDGRGGAAALWGSVDCQARDRVFTKRGGRPTPASAGGRAGPPTFRKLRVLDGDDYFGERCELGHNDRWTSPVVLYHDGFRRITSLSLKLGDNFPLGASRWQTVMQMKETQPYDARGGRGPMINLHAFDGRWRLIIDGQEVWSAPAVADRWTRLAFDITYSADPRLGSVRAFVDRNGDGDARDGGERSREIRTATLRREGPGTTADGLAPGDPIPLHLRVGIYHDPAYVCHGFRCSLGIDDVGVFEPHG
jgi:hypothetical protein